MAEMKHKKNTDAYLGDLKLNMTHSSSLTLISHNYSLRSPGSCFKFRVLHFAVSPLLALLSINPLTSFDAANRVEIKAKLRIHQK
ncbi:hypothetical protein COLO4_32284 [Corchorus olitorius]|uniref:Uncharacterized protein n=1 Tax=Corchorus olitorius TaxID=93759 RepID=A0A1R3H050_9ROSI|nr:hypothetical protein COLO4_32284 [Corchorus olitorius]